MCGWLSSLRRAIVVVCSFVKWTKKKTLKQFFLHKILSIRKMAFFSVAQKPVKSMQTTKTSIYLCPKKKHLQFLEDSLPKTATRCLCGQWRLSAYRIRKMLWLLPFTKHVISINNTTKHGSRKCLYISSFTESAEKQPVDWEDEIRKTETMVLNYNIRKTNITATNHRIRNTNHLFDNVRKSWIRLFFIIYGIRKQTGLCRWYEIREKQHIASFYGFRNSKTACGQLCGRIVLVFTFFPTPCCQKHRHSHQANCLSLAWSIFCTISCECALMVDRVACWIVGGFSCRGIQVMRIANFSTVNCSSAFVLSVVGMCLTSSFIQAMLGKLPTQHFAMAIGSTITFSPKQWMPWGKNLETPSQQWPQRCCNGPGLWHSSQFAKQISFRLQVQNKPLEFWDTFAINLFVMILSPVTSEAFRVSSDIANESFGVTMLRACDQAPSISHCCCSLQSSDNPSRRRCFKRTHFNWHSFHCPTLRCWSPCGQTFTAWTVTRKLLEGCILVRSAEQGHPDCKMQQVNSPPLFQLTSQCVFTFRCNILTIVMKLHWHVVMNCTQRHQPELARLRNAQRLKQEISGQVETMSSKATRRIIISWLEFCAKWPISIMTTTLMRWHKLGKSRRKDMIGCHVVACVNNTEKTNFPTCKLLFSFFECWKLNWQNNNHIWTFRSLICFENANRVILQTKTIKQHEQKHWNSIERNKKNMTNLNFLHFALLFQCWHSALIFFDARWEESFPSAIACFQFKKIVQRTWGARTFLYHRKHLHCSQPCIWQRIQFVSFLKCTKKTILRWLNNLKKLIWMLQWLLISISLDFIFHGTNVCFIAFSHDNSHLKLNHLATMPWKTLINIFDSFVSLQWGLHPKKNFCCLKNEITKDLFAELNFPSVVHSLCCHALTMRKCCSFFCALKQFHFNVQF